MKRTESREKNIKKLFREFMSAYLSYTKTFNIQIPREKGRYFAERIKRAVLNKEKIIIFGDYDADGLLSTSQLVLLIEAIGKALGVDEVFVTFKIPTRAEHYGIRYEQFQAYLDIYDLVITSDNGTHAQFFSKLTEQDHDKLIIIDHHPLIDPTKVTAETKKSVEEFNSRKNIVNPNIDGSVKISTGILNEALFMFTREEIPELKEISKTDDYSDLAAITLISDMADKNNKTVRSVINKGLKKINKRERAIYQYLFPTFNGVPDREITVEDIGFLIAPLLNSGPRMSSAVNAIPHLIMRKAFREDEKRSKEYRAFIDGMDTLIYTNELRKEVTDIFTKEADIEMQKLLEANPSPNISVLKIDNSPIGINGLIASNISQKYGIPTIIVSYNIFGEISKDGEVELLGSGRGEGVRQILTEFKNINTESKESINFGGHDMAVGVSIPKWDVFNEELIEFNKKPFKGLQLSTHKVFNDKAISIKDYKTVCSEYENIAQGIDINDNIFVKIEAFVVGVNDYRNNFKNIILQDEFGETLTLITRPSATIDLLSLDKIEIAVSLTLGNSSSRFADILSIQDIRPDAQLLKVK